jgi:hypothetical protein
VRAVIDLAGQTFGALTVTTKAGSDKSTHMNWNAVCTCGRKTVVRGAHLRRGQTRSCGKISCGKSEVIGAFMECQP